MAGAPPTTHDNPVHANSPHGHGGTMSMKPTSTATQSTHPRWIRITEPENIPLREGRGVEVDGHQIALFNLGDRFLAVENRCPHRGGPLSDGIVAGDVVVCPLHG